MAVSWPPVPLKPPLALCTNPISPPHPSPGPSLTGLGHRPVTLGQHCPQCCPPKVERGSGLEGLRTAMQGPVSSRTLNFFLQDFSEPLSSDLAVSQRGTRCPLICRQSARLPGALNSWGGGSPLPSSWALPSPTLLSPSSQGPQPPPVAPAYTFSKRLPLAAPTPHPPGSPPSSLPWSVGGGRPLHSGSPGVRQGASRVSTAVPKLVPPQAIHRAPAEAPGPCRRRTPPCPALRGLSAGQVGGGATSPPCHRGSVGHAVLPSVPAAALLR